MANRAAVTLTNVQVIRGRLSGRDFVVPEDNVPPMPALTADQVVHNGKRVTFSGLDSTVGYRDGRSFRRKFGLVIPATNTSMEHELWSILAANQHRPEMMGIGLHSVPVVTPNPTLESDADLLAYKEQFLNGLRSAVDVALLANPQYMIMGMSLEHILCGIDAVRAPVAEIETYSGLSWATWHDAVAAALAKYQAKKIGMLTPFNKKGTEFATRMFVDLGFDVVSSVGFSCSNALHIAHLPAWAKEQAILQLLATRENRLDAIVQCGTNMSLLEVTERIEPLIGIPILGINATTLWYALRENGFSEPLQGAGRLFREF